MDGPHSSDPTAGSQPAGFPAEHPAGPTPGGPAFAPGPTTDYAAQQAPVPYPRQRSKRRLIIGLLVAVVLVAATTVAIVYGVRTNGANTGTSFSEAAVKSAIQDYLDGLEHRDTEVIARNALCGLYDGVRDKRSDQALAKMSSDAFRKQFSDVQVTSIDKIVYLSQYQAQALFTMRVTPSTGGPAHGDVQGVAQLLFQRGQILVCSYVLRTGGSY